MRKFISFMVAATAIFGAVSCNKELPQDEQVPAGEKVVFTATVDGADTKAVLNESTLTSEWVANDAITIHNGTKGCTFTTTGSGASADFEYEGEFSGEKFMAVYPAGEYTVDVANKTVNAYIPTYQGARVGSYNENAALAVAYTEDNTFAFKNAHALLKFTVKGSMKAVEFYGNNSEAITGNMLVSLNEDGTIKSVEGQETEFTEQKWNEETQQNEEVKVNKYGTWVKIYSEDEANNWCFTEGKTYYAVVSPADFTEGFSVNYILADDSMVEKAKTYGKSYTLKPNTILDLGELEYVEPVVHEWAIAGTFNNWSNTANPMTKDGDYYVAKNVKGLNYSEPNQGETGSSTGIKFVNNGETWRGGEGQVTAGTWAYVWGDGSNIYVDGASAETAYDIYVNPSEGDYGKFVIVAAGEAMPEDKPVEEPVAQEWYLVGNFNGWTTADANYKMTLEGDWYVFKNFTADGNGVKFVADADADDEWAINRGGSFVANQAIEVSQGGADMTVTAGKYDVYLSADAATAYFMTPGLLPGEAPEPEGIYAEEGWVYLKPNSNWTQASARFAIYFYGKGETWVSMTKVEGTNYYGVNISDIISNGYTGMIFCRMNPGAAANNWDNKWNQTGDLSVSTFTSGKNCFSVPSGSWDGATTGWSTVTKLN